MMKNRRNKPRRRGVLRLTKILRREPGFRSGQPRRRAALAQRQDQFRPPRHARRSRTCPRRLEPDTHPGRRPRSRGKASSQRGPEIPQRNHPRTRRIPNPARRPVRQPRRTISAGLERNPARLSTSRPGVDIDSGLLTSAATKTPQYERLKCRHQPIFSPNFPPASLAS
jgi:hypothetical protein